MYLAKIYIFLFIYTKITMNMSKAEVSEFLKEHKESRLPENIENEGFCKREYDFYDEDTKKLLSLEGFKFIEYCKKFLKDNPDTRNNLIEKYKNINDDNNNNKERFFKPLVQKVDKYTFGIKNGYKLISVKNDSNNNNTTGGKYRKKRTTKRMGKKSMRKGKRATKKTNRRKTNRRK